MINMKAAADAVRALNVDQHTAIHAMVNALAVNRGLAPPWDAPTVKVPELDSIEAIGEVHQLLLGGQKSKRGQQGSYYTPEPISAFMTRFVMDINLSRLEDRHPLDTLVVDPSCGAGVFLVEAARTLTVRLIELELVVAPTEKLIRGLLPYLAGDCIFGVDIDPIAVDLAKSALWLESDGVPISWMDRNIIIGDTLNGDEPPRLRERRSDPLPGADRSAVGL